ncbi:MAG: Ubiquinol-cytochrome c reductase iron-sulfur subunit [Steroidobacteraceae bacterium]|nr:Ubiquinol-cytochrome c reductase iron-sulfur subunit [Steroidobacteraceae bacterium]
MTEISATDDLEIDQSRRRFLTAATVATGAVGAAFAITPFIKSWNPSERARALGAPVEVDVAKIDPGQMVVTSWRKQAIYVVHRTPEMVATLPQNDARLKDPTSADSDQPPYAKNEMRSLKPEYLVLIGICTHLGCLPKQHFERGDAALGADWPGGFFCPCHGSKFDMAGRVMDGSPASVNLRIPPYHFDGDTLTIGVDPQAQKGVA